eukprot:5026169-Pyramimonas_sp.AAC.1
MGGEAAEENRTALALLSRPRRPPVLLAAPSLHDPRLGCAFAAAHGFSRSVLSEWNGESMEQ